MPFPWHYAWLLAFLQTNWLTGLVRSAYVYDTFAALARYVTDNIYESKQ